DRQAVVDGGNIQRILLHARQRHFEHVVVALGVQIQGQGTRAGRATTRADHALLVELVHGIPQTEHIAEWVPTPHRHRRVLLRLWCRAWGGSPTRLKYSSSSTMPRFVLELRRTRATSS